MFVQRTYIPSCVPALKLLEWLILQVYKCLYLGLPYKTYQNKGSKISQCLNTYFKIQVFLKYIPHTSYFILRISTYVLNIKFTVFHISAGHTAICESWKNWWCILEFFFCLFLCLFLKIHLLYHKTMVSKILADKELWLHCEKQK